MTLVITPRAETPHGEQAQAEEIVRRNAGELANSELWSFEVKDGALVAKAYDGAAAGADSNPVQYWGTDGVATEKDRSSGTSAAQNVNAVAAIAAAPQIAMPTLIP